ncbi:MAG: hypothetical protein MPN21_14230 [Thermoanaerobaculia bacterium]|nr:hypothetical protein [Thermoanaerobaculia bacterium]
MLRPFPRKPIRRNIDPDQEFWELVGLMVEGMKSVLLGAVRFRRQATGTTARRSLSQYLSAPHSELGVRKPAFPSHLLQVAVRAESRSLTEFVDALNSGEEPSLVLVDRDLIRLCFDFRLNNPSIERKLYDDHSISRMGFRSRAGHVITGLVHSPARRLHRDETFFGVTDVLQHTPIGDLPLPDLVVHRRFFALAADCPEGGLPPHVFAPETDAVRPLIGVRAWRFFMARRERMMGADEIGKRVREMASVSC